MIFNNPITTTSISISYHLALTNAWNQNMPWPTQIVKLFDLAKSRGERDESEFYGPFNTLLNYLFPYDEDYEIVPQYKRPEQSKSVDFTTIFIVRHEKHPVLFVEIKCSNHILQKSTRQAADQQMREQFTDLFDNVEIETLYGLSAIGTKLCIYTADKQTGRLLPKQNPSSLEFVTDTAPIDRWDIDIMTPEGEERLWQVVSDIKSMCL